MPATSPIKFKANINIIGINPFVFVPPKILKEIFKQAGRDKSPIPIKGTINDNPYKQTLVRYSDEWRLYINTVMLKNSPKRIGEKIEATIGFDSESREVEMPAAFAKALKDNKEAAAVFEKLTPSLKKEIVRYLAKLKTAESLNRNIVKAIGFLIGKEKFVGRILSTDTKNKQMAGKENRLPGIEATQGREKYLPKKAWHAVQRNKGRITPTKQNSSGTIINEDAALEKEADRMGAGAMNSIKKRK